MPSLTLVVMAAGIGSRYGGLKQIDPVGPSGEVVLDYSVFDALRAGFDRVVFIIRKDIEAAFRDRIGRRIERAADTAYVLQSLDQVPPGFRRSRRAEEALGHGPGHPGLQGRRHDAVPGRQRRRLLRPDGLRGHGRLSRARGRRRGTAEFAMVGYRLENTLSEHGTVARGVCEATADGYLVGIRELLKIKRFPDGIKHTENDVDWIALDPASWTSMNFWGFTPDLFGELESRFPEFLRTNAARILKAEFLIPEVVGELIREKRARVKVLPTRERWFGVTYPEDRPLFQSAILALVEAGVYPRDLWGAASGGRQHLNKESR